MKQSWLLLVLLLVSVTAHAQVLFGRDYYDVVKQHLIAAKDTINIAMYFVIMDDSQDNRKRSMNRILSDLNLG